MRLNSRVQKPISIEKYAWNRICPKDITKKNMSFTNLAEQDDEIH